ncbi:MAG: hypothetical protein ACI4C0_07435 [Lachnospiraceae bacterium]
MPDNYMNKNTKKTLLIIAIIFAVVLIFMLLLLRLFDTQYNLKTGISHYMNAIYDEHQEKEYIGSLDGYKVYPEGLSKEDCYYQDIYANSISLTDAIANQMISIDDMIKKAWEQEEKDSCIIYKFENYQIVVGDEEFTIGALK